MPSSINVSHHCVNGHSISVITLENERLRLTIYPEAGAKIASIVHLASSTELLWKNPLLEVVSVPPGSSYDDAWAGGWDELFPNDEPSTMDGLSYPDHGELWTSPWKYRIEEQGRQAVLRLSTCTPVTGCVIEKRISLSENSERILFHHRFTNPGAAPVPYLWKLHPALAVRPGDRLYIPAERFLLEPSSPGTLQGGAVEPGSSRVVLDGRVVDLLDVPPASKKELYFTYGVGLKEGWCGFYRPSARLGAGLAFSKDGFSACWLFASYGGWRDHYVAVLEPCTGYPFRLEEIIASGRGLWLQPGASFETNVIFTVSGNIDGISHITPEGRIVP